MKAAAVACSWARIRSAVQSSSGVTVPVKVKISTSPARRCPVGVRVSRASNTAFHSDGSPCQPRSSANRKSRAASASSSVSVGTVCTGTSRSPQPKGRPLVPGTASVSATARWTVSGWYPSVAGRGTPSSDAESSARSGATAQPASRHAAATAPVSRRAREGEVGRIGYSWRSGLGGVGRADGLSMLRPSASPAVSGCEAAHGREGARGRTAAAG